MTVPRMWEGERCFILGGGPSLPVSKLHRLKGENVIAVNKAYEEAPFAQVLYFMDDRFYEDHKERMNNFGGLIFSTCKRTKDDDRIIYLGHSTNKTGPPNDQENLPRGTNSGFGALNLAIMLGAKRITLLGFDMRTVDGRHNYHRDHSRAIRDSIYKDQFVHVFKKLQPKLEKIGVEVINATPGSGLDAFPICDPEEVLP